MDSSFLNFLKAVFTSCSSKTHWEDCGEVSWRCDGSEGEDENIIVDTGFPYAKVTASDLTASIAAASDEIKPWMSGCFANISRLEDAVGNKGHVDSMSMRSSSGRFLAKVAVKLMPNEWVCRSAEDFDHEHPFASERPWLDFGMLRLLNDLDCPYVSDFVGLYRDDSTTYFVSSLATAGDLYRWQPTLTPGPIREKTLQPIMCQAFEAVRWLHDHGIAHRDISLENILLTRDGDGQTSVRICDFAMSTLHRQCHGKVRGKPVYRAPELYKRGPHDTFHADNFALGVTAFSAAVRDYPWQSTRECECQMFEYAGTFGLRALLEKRKLRSEGGSRKLIECFSDEMVELLSGLLDFQPKHRAHLGECAMLVDKKDGEIISACRSSVWDYAWTQGL